MSRADDDAERSDAEERRHYPAVTMQNEEIQEELRR
jgi:hypothetical protein